MGYDSKTVSGHVTGTINNPGADRRGVSSPGPRSGAERRDKVLDEVGTAIHGGVAAVQKGDTLPPNNTNKPSLTPLCP